jgi:glycosyltransferase involved in cell wall biosynthesis
MRLLIAADTVATGGAGRINQLLAEGLRARGMEVILAGPEHLGHPDPLAPAGSGGGQALLEDRLPAAQTFAVVRPDLVLFACGGPHSLVAAREEAAAQGIPFISLVHQVDGRWASPELQPRIAALFAASREVVAVSEHNLRLLRSSFGLEDHRGRVIVNALPEPCFAPIDPALRGSIRQELGLPPEALLVLTAARVDLAKGPQHLLEVVRSLPSAGEDAATRLRFVWAGEGPPRKQLTALARMLGQGERLRFIGPRADVLPLLAAADLAVLPSEAEGMPLAVLESMALGVPMIAADAGGTAEALADTGVVVGDLCSDREGTRERLLAALVRLARDPGERRRLGDLAWQRARRLFRQERMVGDYLDVLEQSLADPGTATNQRSQG